MQTTIDGVESRTDGIYYYYDYTREFASGLNENDRSFTVRFYQLDLRWYLHENEDYPLLGEEQTMWFENLIGEGVDSGLIDFHIISTGITMFVETDDEMNYFNFESWGENMTDWLADLLDRTGIIEHTVVLSGDVHFSTIYRKKNIFELVASSLTHSIGVTGELMLEGVLEDDSMILDPISENNMLVLDIGYDGFEAVYVSDKGDIEARMWYDGEIHVEKGEPGEDDDDQEEKFVKLYSGAFWLIIAMGILIVLCCCFMTCMLMRGSRKEHQYSRAQVTDRPEHSHSDNRVMV
jgi:hypothetical protein